VDRARKSCGLSFMFSKCRFAQSLARIFNPRAANKRTNRKKYFDCGRRLHFITQVDTATSRFRVDHLGQEITAITDKADCKHAMLPHHEGLGVKKDFTDSRSNTIIVNTPRTVPNGINMHSMQAITKQNV
jgi:hypothetical protein